MIKRSSRDYTGHRGISHRLWCLHYLGVHWYRYLVCKSTTTTSNWEYSLYYSECSISKTRISTLNDRRNDMLLQSCRLLNNTKCKQYSQYGCLANRNRCVMSRMGLTRNNKILKNTIKIPRQQQDGRLNWHNFAYCLLAIKPNQIQVCYACHCPSFVLSSHSVSSKSSQSEITLIHPHVRPISPTAVRSVWCPSRPSQSSSLESTPASRCWIQLDDY